MNWLDILILLAIGFSIVTGFLAGFARMGIGFAATLLGIFCGFWFYGMAAVHVYDYVNSWPIANLIGFFVIFGLVGLLGAVVSRLVAMFFKMVGLSWLDRILGAGFGFVRGVVIAIASVTVLLAFAPNPPPQSIVESKLLPYVIESSNVLSAVTPRPIKEAFRQTQEKLHKIWSMPKFKTGKREEV